MMEEVINVPGCGRADDLIAFLYNEATEGEAQSFQQHLLTCSRCSKEFSTFNRIRKPLFAWRQQSLGYFAGPIAVPAESRSKSAVAAIREFLSLSPWWMKGAAAFASVLFCLLAGLAVARFLSPSTPQVVNPGYTQQQLDSLVERQVQEKLVALEADNNREAATLEIHEIKKKVVYRRTHIPTQLANTRRPLSKNERLQLAADLRLAASHEDMDLDLLSDRLSRQDEPGQQ